MGKFQFKRFAVIDDHSAMKIGTDGVLLGAWTPVKGFDVVIDAGCGSGLIALMLAQRTEGLATRIIGVELDSGAAADARSNAATSPWAERIEILEGDVLSICRPKADALLLVANPPFFNEPLRSPSASRALARHGSDFCPLSLIALASRLFASEADRLAFIVPSTRDDEIEFSLSLNRLNVIEKCAVCTRASRQPSRTMWLVGLAPAAPGVTSLCIRDVDNNYTSEYLSLTSTFYLDRP